MDSTNEKELQVARVVEEFKREKHSGKIEIGFKFGDLVGCKKEIVVLK